MASLTQVSISTRKVIRYGVYLTIFIIIARFSILTGIKIYKRMFPEPPPEPTVAFGKLPTLPFPEKDKAQNLSYKLETPEGELPLFGDQLPVFQMPSFSTNIKALDEAKQKSQNLGFSGEGKSLITNIPNVYVFKKPNAPSLLTINIITGVFSVNYDIKENPAVLTRRPPSVETAITSFESFLSRVDAPTGDLKGEPITKLLKIDSGELVEAISLSDSNFVKVNFFRTPITFLENQYSSVTPDYPESNVWYITNGTDVIAAEYLYYPIDYQKIATYPIITAEKAWEELQSGKAYIANSSNFSDDDQVVIRRVYLAFYDAGVPAEYYQPVVVFAGDDDFIAYLPAITDEYYGKEE